MKIIYNGHELDVSDNTRLSDITQRVSPDEMICGAFVNNRVSSLNHIFKDDEVVKTFDVRHDIGRRIYENSLLFICCMALNKLYADIEFMVKFSLGGGIYIEAQSGFEFSPDVINNIKAKISSVIKEDIPIVKEKYTKDEIATFISEKRCTCDLDLFEYVKRDLSIFNEKADNLLVLSKDSSAVYSLYEVCGYYGYFYSKMLSRTSQLRAFDVVMYDDGMVILPCSPDNFNVPLKLNPQRMLHSEQKSYERWAENLDVQFIATINDKVKSKLMTSLITVAEARHEQLITNMTNVIYEQRDVKRFILIAGPSSAGKTTTAKRLRTHLIAKGLKPISIELDNYFVDREDTPLDEFGELDFECIGAVDVTLFNKHLKQLMEGKEVEIPIYDFKEGRRSPVGRKVSVEKGNPIIIEGIHGLNDALTPDIKRENKYKIYVNDLTHINFDCFNRVPTSDIRLIRRIVRDNLTRGHDALKTISMWQSVRRGEAKNIFPFAVDADFIFNSSLLYELSALRKYAIPSLEKISEENCYYYEAQRLINILSYFLPVEDESPIYSNSILKEYIGGNVFETM